MATVSVETATAPVAAEAAKLQLGEQKEEKIWLEELGLQHLEDFHEIWSSPETLIWSGQSVKTSLEESKAFLIASIRATKPDCDQLGLMVYPDPLAKEPKSRPKMVGVIGVHSKSDEGYEFGYTISHKYWRRGYGIKMLHLFAGKDGEYWKLEHRKDVKELIACVDTDNHVSLKMIATLNPRSGKILEKAYGLGRNKGPDGEVPEHLKRDLIPFYIVRPGTGNV
ncbi:GNAT domain-containing protein [Xylogone sp. PMI_703]|nr:GNAT domain-containing protein [Xylogone sp. PMI_703]